MDIEDITFHKDNPYAAGHAAINVRVRNFGSPDILEKIMTRYTLSEERAQVALDSAYESARSSFWDWMAPNAADEILKPVFGGAFKVFSEGRSGGWLVVYQNDQPFGAALEVQEWTPEQVAAWDEFGDQIESEIAYLCRDENIFEDIEDCEGLLTLDERAAAVIVEMGD